MNIEQLERFKKMLDTSHDHFNAAMKMCDEWRKMYRKLSDENTKLFAWAAIATCVSIALFFALIILS